MQELLGEGAWRFESSRPGPAVCLAFGVHGDERPPIDAGLRLVDALSAGQETLERGRLLLLFGNPRAAAQGRRWSEGGVDLNRCFHPDVLARTPAAYEEARGRDIARFLHGFGAEVLVDFHCTVEPGRRFLMQHPPADRADHAAVYELLRAEVLLADPALTFGGVSLDEWMTTRGRVGICYETGWKDDPANTPDHVHAEMLNVLRGLGLAAGTAQRHRGKRLLELAQVLTCAREGFRWEDGVGENLQALPAGTVLGRYADAGTAVLPFDATLVFPKKKPGLLVPGKPLVYLARAVAGPGSG